MRQQATKVSWYNKCCAALMCHVQFCIWVPIYSNSAYDLFTSVMHMLSVRCPACVDSLLLSRLS